MLSNLQQLVKELKKTNSSNEKKAILKKYPQCKKLLKYTYSTFHIFGVTSANCKKLKSGLAKKKNKYKTIIELLDDLRKRKITGHDAISSCNAFVSANKKYSELIYTIIDKNLKCRIDASIINKVFPKCVPVFDVALAYKFQDHAHKVDFENDVWLSSRKLNGLRCIIACDKKGVVKALSRTGKEFKTLDVILEKFKGVKDTVFDGEICIVKEDGIEDFKAILKEYKMKNHTIKNPKYCIFDCMPYVDFYATESEHILSKRYSVAKKKVARLKTDSVELLKQERVFSFKQVQKELDDAVFWGWEGRIIRKDIPYESGRSMNILKVKKMKEAEYKVVGIESTKKRMIVNGKEKEVTCMGTAVIKHKKNPVGVGSGWSDEQRIEYHKNPDLIIGKVITVQYFEESKDKKGKLSLQFPVLKGIHGKKRTT